MNNVPNLALGRSDRKRNTIPMTQANFDALMEAMHRLAERVAVLEREHYKGDE